MGNTSNSDSIGTSRAYKTIIVENGGDGVTTLTFNRPATMNAYTSEMCAEINDALLAFTANDAQRALIITGTGKGFCTGGDLKSSDGAAERQLGHAIVMREGMHPVIRTLHSMDKPTIAAVNGAAVAGGLALAAACDFRIAARSARLGDTAVRVGLLSDEGGPWLFQRLIGLEATKRMSLLGEIYDAEEAHRLGLVGQVVDDDVLIETARAMAGKLAAGAPLSIRLNNRMIDRASTSTLDECLDNAALSVMISNDSEDSREGTDAFRTRRTPTFNGR
ncbi:enoyl-CoA hydratase/carnithine racemase [Antricoccus suffuscus]|uniref:Enoyl-CoA hydratase/carnithine racemase n=1 Tax=Antricoccus suffuscus TaxID=1629062 RepID=A0A2T0ZZ30_9ACTN|nr:enoyl-CoA hydratase-related protein [Antricoccus suffuscus]PRZ41603.1 enoyl-CoA hydratase/carnithine racemase [Antricoccus suffuscus]